MKSELVEKCTPYKYSKMNNGYSVSGRFPTITEPMKIQCN